MMKPWKLKFGHSSLACTLTVEGRKKYRCYEGLDVVRFPLAVGAVDP
jgi:hypothetical protein